MAKNKPILVEDFIVPPFSVFDTRMGYWKERKRLWKEWLGITNETRENVLYDNLEMKLPDLYRSSKDWRERHRVSFDEYIRRFVPKDKIEKYAESDTFNGASSFDPVLAEIACRWFTPGLGARVFDCFSGGITKGAVATKCGFQFFGLELREEQVRANLRKTSALGVAPEYVCDDGGRIVNYLGVSSQDLFLTCPPYWNLEVYSDKENDLSNQPDYNSFLDGLSHIFSMAVRCLKKNRFAVVVVGDIRDRAGYYYNFPGDVIKHFQKNGCALWNDIAIIGNDAHANLRARQYMNRRKVVRIHQRMLVFYNGRPSAIPKYFDKLKSLTSYPII